MTPARLKIYLADLLPLGKARLTVGFVRARRELKWFPKLSELLELVNGIEKERLELEADAKFEWLRHNSGNITFRQLEPRFAYAVRSCGGIKAIQDAFDSPRISDDAFCKKRFCEAYLRYDKAVDAGLDQLPASPVLSLLKATSQKALQAPEERPMTRAQKEMPKPLSEEELAARRNDLREQARRLGGL